MRVATRGWSPRRSTNGPNIASSRMSPSRAFAPAPSWLSASTPSPRRWLASRVASSSRAAVPLILQRLHDQVAVRNRTVVALQHERAGFVLLPGQAARRGLGHLDVFVDHLVVQRHLQELRILDLLA